MTPQEIEDADHQAFLDKLEPTFLKFDYQGRVIRLDSFSKTIAPGARLGWYTCSPLFAERFERQAETSTQNPNGFGQALVATLLCEQWGGVDDYLRWLRGLRAQYTMRRDFTVDCFAAAFTLSEHFEDGVAKLIGSARQGETTLFEFIPPVGGMFIWIKLHLHNHPAAAENALSDQQIDEIERALWTELAEEGLLVTPGWYFNAAQLQGKGHFRIAYSYTEADEMRAGVQIFARVVKRAFQVE
ncbi:PLP-dependent transferase [Auricularia subglabra TFB-10046 SS5]|nr:PLP-dependent transferase [Auricularia subglabra TFB-10046 SS5]